MPEFLWERNDGAISIYGSGKQLIDVPVLPPDRIPPGLVVSATNVDLADHYVCRPRRGMAALATTGSPPTNYTSYLFTQRSSNFTTSTTASTISETLWAFASNGSAAMTAHSFNGTTWTSHTLPDTATTAAQPHCCAYNGKLFTAYNSASNRLHCYDGTSWRRVGVIAPAAATVANTGAGAYAATLRYYKIKMAILDASSNVVACSELGASVSFTPSGAGTAARITKPTTVDSATHWQVFVSVDDVNYAIATGYIVVGTTTFDDTVSWTAATVAGNTAAPEVGLYVPPPSARFLCTDGTRLLMAGSFETSAGSSGETTPNAKRVWFTRPIGATDEGDDESITQTSTSRYFIDIDDNENGTITGLASMNGLVYVFFPQAVWRLIPTGLSDVPYRAEKISASAGAASQSAITVGAMADGAEDAIYAIAERTGFHRISASQGVEWLGTSVIPRSLAASITDIQLSYEQGRRDLWVILRYNGSSDTYVGVIDLARFRRYENEYYGGMRVFSPPTVQEIVACAPYGNGMALSVQITPPVGSPTYAIYDLSGGLTDGGSPFTSTVWGPAVSASGRRVAVHPPLVRFGPTGGSSGAVTIGLSDYHQNPVVAAAKSVTVGAASGAFGVTARMDGLEIADAFVPFATISLDSSSAVTAVESVLMPYTAKEPM